MGRLFSSANRSESTQKSAKDISIIGVGLPRTGTTSLKIALETLGFGPVHHGIECFVHPEQAAIFRDALKGIKFNWKIVLHGYGATLDAPSCLFYEELMEMWPNAKIILTVRDSDEVWFKSYDATINYDMTMLRYIIAYPFPRSRFMFNFLEEIARGWTRMYGAITPSMHSVHNERVKKHVPADKLLVFNVKEGWKPLCNFLGVPEPSIPFPKTNDTEQFRKHRSDAKIWSITYWICGIGVLIGGILFVTKSRNI